MANNIENNISEIVSHRVCPLVMLKNAKNYLWVSYL